MNNGLGLHRHSRTLSTWLNISINKIPPPAGRMISSRHVSFYSNPPSLPSPSFGYRRQRRFIFCASLLTRFIIIIILLSRSCARRLVDFFLLFFFFWAERGTYRSSFIIVVTLEPDSSSTGRFEVKLVNLNTQNRTERERKRKRKGGKLKIPVLGPRIPRLPPLVSCFDGHDPSLFCESRFE